MKIRKDVTFPAIVATGCARSGTTFLAKLLTQGGITMSHEAYYGFPFFGCTYREGAIGDVGWIAAPFLQREQVRGALTIQIVRHPLKVISSMAHVHTLEDHNFKSNLYTMCKELYLPKLRRFRLMDRYIYNWLKWNKMIAPYADLTYRLEDLVQNPKELFDDLGIDVKGKKLSTKKVNDYSNVKQFDWEDFRDCLYFNELLEAAYHYKYLTEEEVQKLRKG